MRKPNSKFSLLYVCNTTIAIFGIKNPEKKFEHFFHNAESHSINLLINQIKSFLQPFNSTTVYSFDYFLPETFALNITKIFIKPVLLIWTIVNIVLPNIYCCILVLHKLVLDQFQWMLASMLFCYSFYSQLCKQKSIKIFYHTLATHATHSFTG